MFRAVAFQRLFKRELLAVLLITVGSSGLSMAASLAFGPEQTIVSGPSVPTRKAVAGDLDGDGDTDLVAASAGK